MDKSGIYYANSVNVIMDSEAQFDALSNGIPILAVNSSFPAKNGGRL